MMRWLSVSSLLLVISCGDGSDKPIPIGVTVSGLAGSGLVLQNNGGDDLPVAADGTYAFATALENGDHYDVTVSAQPSSPAQTCAVADGSGTVESGTPVAISITCTTSQFTVGGTVTGLAGTGLVLQNNGGDDLTITADGSFTFATPVTSGQAFAVTVKTQPTGPQQTCTVANAAGTVGDSHVTGVTVTCATDHFTVGGTVSGLAGTSVVLQNNLGDDVTVTADGSFTFPTSIASGAPYSVTVLAQPTSPWQTCVVSAGSGTVVDANITNVDVTCTTNRYTIGGMVTGLTGSGLVLQNNAGDDLTITADGSFAFATSIASGDMFDVSVLTQPTNPWQTCTVSGGTGTVLGGDITTVMVNCTVNQYAISGNVSGLAGMGLQLALNNGTPLPITADGTFAFPTTIASNGMYDVTVVAQPTSNWQTCTVSNGSGTVTSADVTDIQVDCTTNAYPVQVSVTGLAGSGLVLQNNGENLSITGNTTFSFPTAVASGASYNVIVLTNPTNPWQTCSVTSPMGTMTNGVTLAVNCVTNTYSIGGTVQGLVGTGMVLRDNGGNDLPIAGNGSFTFTTKVASGAGYAVTIFAQPSGQTCSVFGGTGTVANANINSVVVDCNPHNDGFNHTWTDGVAAGTYDATQGVKACQVWSTALGINPATCTPTGCGCSGTSSCAYNTATPANNQPRYVWFYSGALAGQVTANCCGCTASATWK